MPLPSKHMCRLWRVPFPVNLSFTLSEPPLSPLHSLGSLSCLPMFMTRVRTWVQLTCPSADDKVSNLSVHVTECYSTLKKKEVQASNLTWSAVWTLWGLGRRSQFQENHTVCGFTDMRSLEWSEPGKQKVSRLGLLPAFGLWEDERV